MATAAPRILVGSLEQADTIWQMLIGQDKISSASIFLDGEGHLFDAVRSGDGRWTTLRRSPEARTSPVEGRACQQPTG